MADYSDGSMIVDTEIDTEGFLKDSEKLKRAVTSLSRQVDSIGRQMKTAIGRNNAAAVEVLTRRFAESQTQADALRSKLEAFSRVKILSDDYIKVTADIDKADAAMKRLIERQEKLKAMGADQASTQWQNTQKDIEETTAKLEEYKRRLREAREDLAFMNTPEQRAEAHAEGPEGWGAYTAELKRLRGQIVEDQAEVNKLTEALGKLTTRQEQLKASGADQGSRQYQSLLYDMEQLRVKQEELIAARDKMESEGKAFKMGDTTAEFEQLNQQLDDTEQHMGQVEQAKEDALATSSVFGFIGFLAGVGRGALHVAASLARVVGSGALSYLRKLASGARNAAIQLMKLAGSAIASGIRRIGSLAASAGKSLLGLGRHAKKSSGGLNVGLKTLLRYGESGLPALHQVHLADGSLDGCGVYAQTALLKLLLDILVLGAAPARAVELLGGVDEDAGRGEQVFLLLAVCSGLQPWNDAQRDLTGAQRDLRLENGGQINGIIP